MTLALYMDHQVPMPVTIGLRQRNIDCLTALEDGHDRADDDVLLQRATVLGRVLFSQDKDFLTITGLWQKQGRDFAGLVYGPQRLLSIGKAVADLELIASIYNAVDMLNRIEFIPYP